MTSRAAAASLASKAQSPMAPSQEQQRAARAPIKRPDSSDEDENNNRRREPPPSSARGQLHKSKRAHCSSQLNLRSCSAGGTSQQQLASSVTQSANSSKEITLTVTSAAAARQRRQLAITRAAPIGPSVKRALEQEARLQRLIGSPQATREPREPLAQVNRAAWKSSTSALSRDTAAPPSWQKATTSSEARSQHIKSGQVSSRGRWCCELPHHATAAHLNTRRQSNLAPLLNRARQDLTSGLRNKRAASSLSLVNTNARLSRGDKSASPQSAASQSRAQSTQNRNTAKTSKPKPEAISSRLEQVPPASSQVTNSRLRQGALFARRQLHLLPAQTLAPDPPRLAEGRNPAPRCPRAQSVAPVPGRTSASRVQANFGSPVGKPSTAAEARRRATRQVVVVATPRDTSGQSQPLQLVKAEKKASHLTSSSSSLSLSAFVVKRPRQQQSSTSSSCSSISTASRRWSSSSGAESPSLSQSCSQLSSNQSDWPHDCSPSTRPSIGGNKTTSENFASGRAHQRPTSTDNSDQRTRSVRAANRQQQHEPKQANGQANDFDPTKRDIELADNLLDPTPIDHIEHITDPIEPSDKSRGQSAATEKKGAAQHAFLVQADEQQPIDQQVNPQTTIELSQLEDADIVAIGCSIVAPVLASPSELPPSSTTKDNFTTPRGTSQRLALHNTMATSATGCNTNEYQLHVTNNNNHDAQKDRSNQQGVLDKNVDMQISYSGDSENINNNIDVNEQHQAASMNKGLISPLDLSSKTFGRNVVTQESAQSSPIGVKNQPLSLHQSMNIAAGSEQLLKTATSVSGQGTATDDRLCAVESTLVSQAGQTTRSNGERLDSSLSVQRASSGEAKDEQNVIAKKQKMAEIPIMLEPISDFYDLESRPFARGKFAQVKRCTRKTPTSSMAVGECYAAKCIKKRRRLVDIRHEILLEIEALKLSFETKHIVRLYEVYETQTEMVLVLEMAKGGELQRVLDDEEQIEEPLVRKMIDQILEGLIHLHDNEIAHLDIKPQNLLLSGPFPDGDIKLCDFGISRRISKDCEIREICGTPDYVAPEILRYDPISLATDMWSLGVLTYVLLSGYSPFGSDNKQQTFCNITQATLDFPQDIFAKISCEAVDFVRKLIVREPAERLTSRQAKQHHWISKHQAG